MDNPLTRKRYLFSIRPRWRVRDRHLGGRLNTSHGEHGRSDIGKTAVLDTGELCLLINDDERHAVGGVSRERMLGTVGSNVKHVIGVAVIGGNQRKAALSENRRDNLGQGIVNSLDGLNGSVEDTGVTNHVAVCEVHDVEISAILVDGGDQASR